ncbi:PREDICTED: uncharacterized abhydrolase domain-containing protein DDB_G0269086-like [Priapulus caudatus]|uniref:Uncharacterized abhydrolase domain-containing protein DDB_G0269086-like n=1 Tax=Priapulus caudatus TaxID=37621 RepID=A0ABM1EZA4_PRICU|nr:PREDICTED: uncharacterized abhydrolase domain-containing protein DDB_G0269086-like [Priapulus caudatus]
MATTSLVRARCRHALTTVFPQAVAVADVERAMDLGTEVMDHNHVRVINKDTLNDRLHQVITNRVLPQVTTVDSPDQVTTAGIPAQAITEETRVIMEETRVIMEETRVLMEETRVLMEETRVLMEETRAIMEETRVIMEETRVLMEETRVLMEETRVLMEETRAIMKDQVSGEEIRKHQNMDLRVPFPAALGHPHRKAEKSVMVTTQESR